MDDASILKVNSDASKIYLLGDLTKLKNLKNTSYVSGGIYQDSDENCKGQVWCVFSWHFFVLPNGNTLQSHQPYTNPQTRKVSGFLILKRMTKSLKQSKSMVKFRISIFLGIARRSMLSMAKRYLYMTATRWHN